MLLARRCIDGTGDVTDKATLHESDRLEWDLDRLTQSELEVHNQLESAK